MFPFAIRNDDAIKGCLYHPENTVITETDTHGELIAASVLWRNMVRMLCVDPEHQGHGLGTRLVNETEKLVRERGYASITFNCVDGYILPGIPTSVPPVPESEEEVDLFDGVTDHACAFFAKRGYQHSWGACNCFDMSIRLSEFAYTTCSIGDTIDGVAYRWAAPPDVPRIRECVNEAHQDFTPFYLCPDLYEPRNRDRIILAEQDGVVLGALIVNNGTEADGVGAAGCTAVRPSARGRHIATNMILLGTRFLKEAGLVSCFIGYTYSGLASLYGRAGYRICTYYLMAHKALT